MPAQIEIAEEKPRRVLIITVALIAAIIIGGFFYLLFRGTIGGGSPAPTLQSAIRPGSADWDKYSKLIPLDDPIADESPRALGDIMMTLQTTARNLTGRTITGLEVRGSVVDHDGKAVKERTLVMIPRSDRTELEPNKTLKVVVVLDGFTDSDDRANIKMEVTGFSLR